MFLLYILLAVALVTASIVVRHRRARRKKLANIRQLRAWVAQNQLLDPVLQLWTQHLTSTEAEIFEDLLSGYCKSLNWELGWLFTPQIEKAPALRAALEEGVSAYACSILLSVQMEDDVKAYHAYVDFERSPSARSQRSRVSQLYRKIDDSRLLPSKGVLDRFSGGTLTRREQIAVIQQAFDLDPARSMEALKEVLIAEEIARAQPDGERLATQVLAAPKAG